MQAWKFQHRMVLAASLACVRPHTNYRIFAFPDTSSIFNVRSMSHSISKQDILLFTPSIRFSEHFCSNRLQCKLWPQAYRTNSNGNCSFLKNTDQDDTHISGTSLSYWTDAQQNGFLRKIQMSIENEILPQILGNPPLQISQENPLVILLAVSGGCDSIALFHSVLQVMDRRDGNYNDSGNLSFMYTDVSSGEKRMVPCVLHCVHFDHGQRQVESDGDRLFVENLCHEFEIPYHCYYWYEDNLREGIDDLEPPLISKKKFSQETARDWRIVKCKELLQSLIQRKATDHQPGVIFTGHHKDDSEETLLLKLLRGVHITNLAGMDVVQLDDKGIPLFAKPMLAVRKTDIHKSLLSQGIKWREDGSNLTNKYKRNRIRNELMPLLSDIAGGEDVLQQRLENLENQSKKLKIDLKSRAQSYLLRTSRVSKDLSRFVLPPREQPLDVVHEEALYLWVSKQSQGKLFLSYKKLLSVKKQLIEFPDRLEWTLNVGSNWNIVRNGDILNLVHNSITYSKTSDYVDQWKVGTKDEDEINLPVNNGLSKSRDIFYLDLPFEAKKLVLRSVNDVRNDFSTVRFLPPWRGGKKPMKLMEFLRGQHIPLHRRGMAPVLLVEDLKQVVAVYVENMKVPSNDCSSDTINGKWILHYDFTNNPPRKSFDQQIILRRNILEQSNIVKKNR